MASKDDADKPPGSNPETAPDPDEDDLDELDEMLDEFSTTTINPLPTAPAAPGASGPGRPTADEPGPPPKDEEDFAEQLQAGMAQMLQDLEQNPDMAKQFGEMMAQFGAPPIPVPTTQTQTQIPPPVSAQSQTATSTTAPRTASASTTDPAAAASKNPDDAFQDTIRRTMERMQASSTSADAAATAGPSPLEDDMMASLLRELQNSSGEGAGGGEDESFSKMLLGMMEQLTNKDILYDPMKELDTKFPGWLAEKGGSLPPGERERYETQRGLVREIVARFERDGYTDENADDREFIVERMQQMQAAGAPPPELVGDVDAANEMVAGLDQGCAQQ